MPLTLDSPQNKEAVYIFDHKLEKIMNSSANDKCIKLISFVPHESHLMELEKYNRIKIFEDKIKNGRFIKSDLSRVRINLLTKISFTRILPKMKFSPNG